MKSLIAALLFTQSVYAATDSGQIEVLQAQATMQYHAKDYKQCLSILDKVLVADPKNFSALELAALSHKQLKNDDAAEKIYKHLIKIAPKDRRAPYYFDLAMIQYRKKDTKQAHKNFNRAVFGNFNAGTALFYMGMIDANNKKWRDARNNLSASLTYSDAKQFEPVTRYYLATAYSQIGNTTSAIQHYREAQAVIDEKEKSGSKPDATSTEIRKNILKELQNFDKGSMQLGLSLMSQWDSNVQTNPVSATDPLTNSSKKSAKAVLGVSASGTTSPARMLQGSASYRYFTNYNTHHLARDYNFMSHTGTLIGMVNPGGRFSAGLKSELIFTMKNNLLTEDSRRELKYRPFNTNFDIGPVAKYEVTPRINVSGEVFYRPKWFYLDPASGDSRRTGAGIFSRLSAEFQSPFTFINPLAYASFEWDHPRGKTYRVYAWGGGVSNPVYVTDKLTVTPSLDFVISDYYAEKAQKRDDDYMAYKLAGMYMLNSNWSALADVTFMDNTSSIAASYTYSRITASLGASYAF